jgi:transposase
VFIDANNIKKIYLHLDYIDFRKGINGLGVYLTHLLGSSLEGQNIFVFCNRAKNKVKILYWDDTGYAMWQKALEKEYFKWPKLNKQELVITVDELKYLLSGLNIELQKPHKKSSAKPFY